MTSASLSGAPLPSATDTLTTAAVPEEDNKSSSVVMALELADSRLVGAMAPGYQRTVP